MAEPINLKVVVLKNPPSVTAAIANLIRLFGVTGDLVWFERAEKALNGWSTTMEKYPRACPTLFAALDFFSNQVHINKRKS